MADQSAPSTIDEVVRGFAAGRWGVFALDEASRLGLTADMASDRAKSGRLHRLYRGVYSVVPPGLLKAEGRWLAAVLACGPGAVLSHTHAAALWELRHRPSGLIHVTIPRRSGRRKRPGVSLHRSSTLRTQPHNRPQEHPGHTAGPNALGPPPDARPRRLGAHPLPSPRPPPRPRRPGRRCGPILQRARATDSSVCAAATPYPALEPSSRSAAYTVDFLWPDQSLVVDDGRLRHPRHPVRLRDGSRAGRLADRARLPGDQNHVATANRRSAPGGGHATGGPQREPPAIAGRMTTVSASDAGVSRPSRTRTSSSFR